MTLLAVPFAVTTGRRGAMYGIGIGIVLAIIYWIMLSVFGALGAGGLLPPDARRVGAEHPVRRGRALHGADGQNVTSKLDSGFRLTVTWTSRLLSERSAS